jgi:hypothetical protein
MSDNSPTRATAQKIVDGLIETNDIVAFAQAVSGRGSHFGRCNLWSRKKFEQHLEAFLNSSDLLVTSCIACSIQTKAQELEDDQLQEILDLCASELDRRVKTRRLIT